MSDTRSVWSVLIASLLTMALGLVTRGACKPLAVLLGGSSRYLIIIDPLAVVGHDVVDAGVEE